MTTETQRLPANLRPWTILLSAFVLFHVGIMIFVPNKITYLNYRFANVVTPYVNLFELSSGWSFFAPEPGPPPVFVEYELLDAESKVIHKARWPDPVDPYFFRDRQNRRIATARYMANGEGRAEKMLAPYLCSQDPKPHAVRMWKVMVGLPGLYEVAQGKRTIGDEVGLDRRSIGLFFCDGPTASGGSS